MIHATAEDPDVMFTESWLSTRDKHQKSVRATKYIKCVRAMTFTYGWGRRFIVYKKQNECP